jgi:N6-L-threonylcarbamoyladenine synthase
MIVLGIETSCDETGVAVYSTQRGLIAEALASQSQRHARYGGVVPELASRDHAAGLAPMVCDVLARGELELSDLDAVAYTAGPGLIGALMVGATFAASLAYGLGIPAIPVHHMEGHLLAPLLGGSGPAFPFLALLVSGGHTQLVNAHGLGNYRIIGETRDDAAGEAFDKVARMLSLPYPGGPALAALAEQGDPGRYAFPRPLRGRGLDMSFSGLKTAVRLTVESELQGVEDPELKQTVRADIAAAFQAAVVDSLAEKCLAAIEKTGLDTLVVAGGVGANAALRAQLERLAREGGFKAHFPAPPLCTDNGAMIAFAGWCRRREATRKTPVICARPRWPLDELRPPDGE